MKTILGLTTAVFGAGVIAHQDPSFEYPVVKPVLASGPAETGDSFTDLQQKPISVRFKDASASEVFDWLSNQGVSFVTAEVPKDAKVTLTLTIVPLNEAIDAIGAALGGGWDRRGNVYVFQRGRFGATTTGGWSSRNMPETFMYNLNDKDQAKKWEELSKQMQKQFGENSPFSKQFKNFDMNGPDQKKWEELSKQMQKEMGPGSDFAKQMQKQFGENSPFSKQFKNFDMNGPDQKKWEELSKQLQKEMGPGSDFEKQMKGFKFDKENFAFPKMDSEAWAKAMKAREEALKVLEEQMKSDKMKGLTVPPLNDPRFSDQIRMFKFGGQDPFSFNGQDLKGLAKSLTESQRQKNKKQGYLNWSDLTPEQQHKLGMKNEGAWSITYSNNGESFTVKSDSHK